LTDKAAKLLDSQAIDRLGRLLPRLEAADPWTQASAEAAVRSFAEDEGIKLGQVAQPLRALLTGDTASPGIFEVMAVLGRRETLARVAERVTPADTVPHTQRPD
jgi:glutamyl-tRNA synthetase